MMLGFGVIIIILFIASLYVLTALNAVSKKAKNSLTANVRAMDLAKHLKIILYEESESAQKYLVTEDENYRTLFLGESEEFIRQLGSLGHVFTGDAEMSILSNIKAKHKAFVADLSESPLNKGLGTPLPDDHQIRKKINTLDASLDRLISLNELSIGNAVSHIEMTTRRSMKISAILMGCTLLVAVAAAFIITQTLTRPIKLLIQGTEQIARGKFKPIQVPSHDEISLLADAVNDMSKKVKQANEYRTNMIQQISHEIRTPLQAILSAHDILKDQGLGPLNPEQLDLLDDIARGIDRLENHSRQYLDLVKIEAGKMDYHMVATDLPDIMAPLIQDARLIGARKNVSLEWTVADVPQIMADPEKIAIVFNNLLSNAVKYTLAGGKVIIKFESCDRGARIIFEDSGLGIRPEDISKVFDKFYQSKSTADITAHGAGVGLALVKAYTEGHGGSVYVESKVNKGSTFVVELPTVPGDA